MPLLVATNPDPDGMDIDPVDKAAHVRLSPTKAQSGVNRTRGEGSTAADPGV